MMQVQKSSKGISLNSDRRRSTSQADVGGKILSTDVEKSWLRDALQDKQQSEHVLIARLLDSALAAGRLDALFEASKELTKELDQDISEYLKKHHLEILETVEKLPDLRKKALDLAKHLETLSQAMVIGEEQRSYEINKQLLDTIKRARQQTYLVKLIETSQEVDASLADKQFLKVRRLLTRFQRELQCLDASNEMKEKLQGWYNDTMKEVARALTSFMNEWLSAVRLRSSEYGRRALQEGLSALDLIPLEDVLICALMWSDKLAFLFYLREGRQRQLELMLSRPAKPSDLDPQASIEFIHSLIGHLLIDIRLDTCPQIRAQLSLYTWEHVTVGLSNLITEALQRCKLVSTLAQLDGELERILLFSSTFLLDSNPLRDTRSALQFGNAELSRNETMESVRAALLRGEKTLCDDLLLKEILSTCELADALKIVQNIGSDAAIKEANTLIKHVIKDAMPTSYDPIALLSIAKLFQNIHDEDILTESLAFLQESIFQLISQMDHDEGSLRRIRSDLGLLSQRLSRPLASLLEMLDLVLSRDPHQLLDPKIRARSYQHVSLPALRVLMSRISLRDTRQQQSLDDLLLLLKTH